MSRAAVSRIAAVVALVAAIAAFGAGGPARADGAAIVEVGWWSQAANPATPEGGFEVGKSPDGSTLSVAAVRIQVDGRPSKALLILTETTGGFLQESAVIEACPTMAPWKAAAGGAIADAPAPDCATKSKVERNATTGSWTVYLVPLLGGGSGTVSVVLQPGTATEVVAPTPPSIPSPVPVPLPVPTIPTSDVPPVATPADPGFTVEFSRADLDAGGTAPSDDAAFAGPEPSTSGAIASGGGSDTFAPTFSAVDTFALTDAPTVTPDRTALPSATADVTAGGAGGVGTAARVESGLQPVAASRGPAPPWGRLFVLVPLSALVGAAGASVRRRLFGRSGLAGGAE